MYMRQKHKDSDSAAKFFRRYLHPHCGTDHSEERRGFRCPFRRELGCRTRLYRNARRTRGHAGQQVCAKPYRPHLPAGERISGIRPSGALFGHSLSNKRFKAFLAKEYENLLTVDLVCHGVPSPEIWRQYLHEIIATGGADIQIPSCGPHPKLRASISGTRRPDGSISVCGSHSAERPGPVFRRRQTCPEYTIKIHSFTASCRM